MKNDEIRNMPAGREMDALVAEKVFALKTHVWTDALILKHKKYFEKVKPYSTDISAAWEVVERLRQKTYWVGVTSPLDGRGTEWICEWTTIDTAIDFASADTAPLAICRAALIACIGEE